MRWVIDHCILFILNMKKLFVSLLEIAEIAIIALGAVFVVRSFLIQPFLVSGSSMAPNFSNGDYVLIDELTYRMREPVRGEVVVFKYPKDESTYFIKRVIGLSGERVVVSNGVVKIYNAENKDGLILGEEYLPDGLSTSGSSDTQLGEEEYFVMGDNRQFSYDSRVWGKVPKKDIIGIARLRLWPPSGLTVFAAPQY